MVVGGVLSAFSVAFLRPSAVGKTRPPLAHGASFVRRGTIHWKRIAVYKLTLHGSLSITDDGTAVGYIILVSSRHDD